MCVCAYLREKEREEERERQRKGGREGVCDWGKKNSGMKGKGKKETLVHNQELKCLVETEV